MNRHRQFWSAMGNSKFEFVNDLDERAKARDIIYAEFKTRIIDDYKNTVLEYSKQHDLVSIDSLIEFGIRALIEEFKS